MILLITKGYTSAYSIWSAMKEESSKKSKPDKVIAYKNIYQRALNLSKHGYLEEIKFDLINMHSSRHYKLTLKGMRQLLPYIKNNPNNVKNLIEYMDKIKFRKATFISVLVNELTFLTLERKSIASALDLFKKYTPEEHIDVRWNKDGEIIGLQHSSSSKTRRNKL